MPEAAVSGAGVMAVGLIALVSIIVVAAALCVVIWPVFWAVRLTGKCRFPKVASRLWIAIAILSPCLGIAWTTGFVLTYQFN